MGNGQFDENDVAQVERDIEEILGVEEAVERQLSFAGRSLTVVAKPSARYALMIAWIDGSNHGEDVQFSLTSGAGLGNPFLILAVSIDGDSVREEIDMRPLLQTWVDEILAERRAEDHLDERASRA
jgi:hypothetical protein